MVKRILYGLLIFGPVAIAGSLLNWSPVIVFVSAALGVIPLADLIGEATEELAIHTGPRIGGLLNATLGNTAELIITIFAIKQGLIELVKASIAGSILGNLLLVLGMSALAGGLKHGPQTFNRRHASLNSTLAVLAVVALIIPSLFSTAIAPNVSAEQTFSESVAVVMILLYALTVIYALTSGQKEPLAEEGKVVHEARWSVRHSLLVLAGVTAAIAVLSELLVGAVEPVVKQLGLTEFFIGIVLIPLIGNVAEHLVGVEVALKNKMELAISISLGSSLQVALFVAPLLVFISLLFGHPLLLVFSSFELIALFGAALIAALITLDGETTWLEGAQLLAVYLIIAAAFYFLPGGV
jgi:Ca2+:H+ antiporter